MVQLNISYIIDTVCDFLLSVSLMSIYIIYLYDIALYWYIVTQEMLIPFYGFLILINNFKMDSVEILR